MKEQTVSLLGNRRSSREVFVGKVAVGGSNPVRIQSMTTTDTQDVAATVDQILGLVDAGCEIVRLTVQGMKEAEACSRIKESLLRKNCDVPLVADIHFYPPAALKVAESVDKIRINPGNFVDKRALFIRKEYDDRSYSEELAKIEERFAPLVLKCKALKRALRIGTNHGSLSDRIMNRYGDTPRGMVESALEFARICVSLDFHDLIFSMKSSNPKVMIEAYRLLCTEMDLAGWNYPLHLGVTEAGEGEDGRIKSALGIGSLLINGIGDTIRVSLTEDPRAEIPPCKTLAELAKKSWSEDLFPPVQQPSTRPVSGKGLFAVDLRAAEASEKNFLQEIDCVGGKRGLFTPDFFWIEEPLPAEIFRQLLGLGIRFISRTVSDPSILKIKNLSEFEGEDPSSVALLIGEGDTLPADAKPALYLFLPQRSALKEAVTFFSGNPSLQAPVLPVFSEEMPPEDALIHLSAQCGGALIEGMFDGLCVRLNAPLEARISLGFSLLQAARRKSVKTEFISCPGCGRTLFDLQTVSRRIRSKTSHLPGVRIAIMGCIVNGPGEMADADFGYVGSGRGKVDLYVGKTCVEKNIDFADADDRLIALIRKEGKWVDPAPL